VNVIFNQLIGTWSLERDILDQIGQSKLVGRCIFTKIDETHLLCEEQGILNYNGSQTETSRSYIYEYRDDKIIILYNDAHRSGDVLHELKFVTEAQNQVARHCHYCGADTYDIEFNLFPEGKIQINYVVQGPHKDYQMRTTLTPS
jgi:hypothetical protein